MDDEDGTDPLHWFGVRCLFRYGDSMYEERITLWRARDFDHAMELAGADAREYSDLLPDADVPIAPVGLMQAYAMSDEPGQGVEVFSLLRDSGLAPDAYLDRYFDTGNEHEVED